MVPSVCSPARERRDLVALVRLSVPLLTERATSET